MPESRVTPFWTFDIFVALACIAMAAAVLLGLHWFACWHWAQNVLGIKGSKAYNAATSPWYNWHSGAGSDLQELGLITALIFSLKRLNCQTPGCWHLHQRVTDHGHKLCHKCATSPLHPDLAPLHESHRRS